MRDELLCVREMKGLGYNYGKVGMHDIMYEI